MFYAVEKGAGIGALPSYACALGADLVPVEIDVRQPMDIWPTYHPDARKTTRISHVIDWVKSIFDPTCYPWFRDEFIHPNGLIELALEQTSSPSKGLSPPHRKYRKSRRAALRASWAVQ